MGPMRVPERNQPRAVARVVGWYRSPMTAGPVTRKDVPAKAVRMRKTKKAGMLGLRAVPMEQAKKTVAETMQVCEHVSHEMQQVRWSKK